jgi:hypothetical protein
MAKVTCDMAVSVDGFVAGPNQSLEQALRGLRRIPAAPWRFEQPEANAAAIAAISASPRGGGRAGRDYGAARLDQPKMSELPKFAGHSCWTAGAVGASASSPSSAFPSPRGSSASAVCWPVATASAWRSSRN